MRYLVHTPVPGYTGEVVGVHFVNGEAVVDDTKHAALQFFGRHGYTVEQIDGDKALEEAAQDVQAAQDAQLSAAAITPGQAGPGAAEGDLRLGQGYATKVPEAADAAVSEPVVLQDAEPSRPAKNAPKEEWATYAAQVLDMPHDEASRKTKPELVALVDEHEKDKENDQ